MEVKKAKEKIVITLLILLALSITQCTTQRQITKEDDEAALKRKVHEYWSYKIRGEWDKCYMYETPDYRKKVNLVGYINQWGRFPMKWDGFDILEVWTSGEEGYVKLNTRYRYLMPQVKMGVFEKAVEEKWIKKDNQWYRYSAPA